MSYWVTLTIDTGGPADVGVTEGRNMTSNVAPVWRAAGADLAEMDGKRAGECLPLLESAVACIDEHPGRFSSLVLGDGTWGTVGGCRNYLAKLAEDCRKHPLATVRVSR